MKKFKILTILIIILFFTFIKGCVKVQLPPPSTLEFHALDTSALKDKVIVLDPGHGGQEHGAVGVKGLRECEVNLTVALYLWGLLNQAGARPVLTRGAEVLLTQGPDFVLHKELRARAEFSNKHKADLFISIHHNSDTGNHEKNHLQVYYKLTDPRASRDIGNEIFNKLQERLNPPQAELIPGNYAVLRNTHAPALLGEASFLTHEDNEMMLAFHRTLLNEAEGYFLGILNYYQKGVPEVKALYPHNTTVTDTQPEMKAELFSGKEGERIELSKIEFTLDDRPVKDSFSLVGRTLSYKPQKPLDNGHHEFCISYRNKAGNASHVKCASFTVASPPCTVQIKPVFSIIPPDGKSKAPVDVHVRDCLNRPVADGTEVQLSTTAGTLSGSPAQTLKGRARAYLNSEQTSKQALIQAITGEISTSSKVFFDMPQGALFMAQIKDLSGKPIKGVKVQRQGHDVSLSDAQGFIYDTVELSGKVRYDLFLKGYEPKTYEIDLLQRKITRAELVLTPVDKGLFLNKTIIFDIENSPASVKSLISALKKKINHAGGTVAVTEDNDLPEEKVVRASKEKATVFITLEVTHKTLAVEHYFRSKKGRKLAQSICQGFEKNKNISFSGTCTTMSSIRFLIVQTEMPAAHLSIPEQLLELLESADRVSSVVYQGLYEMFLN